MTGRACSNCWPAAVAISQPRFGLKVADASRVAQKFGVVPVFGALVGAVAPSSPGEKAGLRAGDIITEINLRRVNNADDLEQALESLSAGSRVTIVISAGRGDQKIGDCALKLTELFQFRWPWLIHQTHPLVLPLKHRLLLHLYQIV